jgi:hypothetical protein
MINNVTYVSPGAAATLPSGNGTTSVILGQGLDYVVGSTPTFPAGTTFIYDMCGHDQVCEFQTNNLLLTGLSSGSSCSQPEAVSAGGWANMNPGVYNPLLAIIYSSLQQSVVTSTISYGGISGGWEDSQDDDEEYQ